MPILFEYYNTGDTLNVAVAGAEWHCQTFTPLTTHTITSIKLKLARFGLPGTITVGIRATSGGLPTGSDLDSGTYDGNSLGTSADWVEITLAAGTQTMSAGVEYAIVIRAPNGDITNNNLIVRVDTSGTYTGGKNYTSLNSGSTWDENTPDDAMFEDWGNPTFIPQVTIII